MTFENDNSENYSNLPSDQKMLARLREAAEVISFMGAKVFSPGEEPEWLIALEHPKQENVNEGVIEGRVAKAAMKVSRKSIASSGAIEQREKLSAVGGMTLKGTKAKYNIDRRMGEEIWVRTQAPTNRGEYITSKQGDVRKKKLSDFGLQLRARQKLKGYYGDLTEKQFSRIVSDAQDVGGDIGESLVVLLERRLDAVVYRAKFAPTIFEARNLVNHGYIAVNGKRMNIPSFRVSQGDTVEVLDEARKFNIVLNAMHLSDRDVPEYIELDKTKMTATFAREPRLADVRYPVEMEPALAMKYYKKQ